MKGLPVENGSHRFSLKDSDSRAPKPHADACEDPSSSFCFSIGNGVLAMKATSQS